MLRKSPLPGLRPLLFVLPLLLALLALPVLPAQAGELAMLRVAAPERQPYFFRMQGEPAGLEADVLVALAESLQLDLDFVSCSARNCLEMVLDGRADLATGLTDQPGMSGKLLFIRPAYAQRSDTVFYRLREAPPLRNQLQLRGKTLGFRRDSPLPREIESDRLIPRIDAASAARLMKLLLTGTVDCVALDESEGLATLETLNLTKRIVSSPFRISNEEPLVFAFSLRSRQLARAGDFEARLRELAESGLLQELRQRYLKGTGVQGESRANGESRAISTSRAKDAAPPPGIDNSRTLPRDQDSVISEDLK